MFQKFRNLFFNFSRFTKQAILVVADASLAFLSLISAIYFKVEEFGFIYDQSFLILVLICISAAIISWAYLGVYKTVLRFITGIALFKVLQGASVAGLVLFISGMLSEMRLHFSVSVLFVVLLFLSVSSFRFLIRQIFRGPKNGDKVPVVIFGAREEGLSLINSLYYGGKYTPIAVIDDDPKLQNLNIGGFKVLEPIQLPKILSNTGARTILLARPDWTKKERSKVLNTLNNLEVEVRSIPRTSELVSGTAKLSELRSISPEELLGRNPVPPNQNLLKINIHKKNVLVSGAGGSIGRELCRQILRQGPVKLILFEQSEHSLYEIENELLDVLDYTKPISEIHPVLGSVQNQKLNEEIIQKYNIDTIFHAAAYKHVPIVENNIIEGFENNVLGTYALALAAKKFKVNNFTLISTDKAVRPTNVMGATKRFAELICQALADNSSETIFTMVRFGNVLASSGSVVPKFSQQIQRGGPVTVTHREITRYFMTIPEASQLVLQASALAKGGDVFVLDMGTPIKIFDLAESMVRLKGLLPYTIDDVDNINPELGDIPILITGLRKGEKLFEELLVGDDSSPTDHPRILTASEVSVSMEKLKEFLKQVAIACEKRRIDDLISLVKDLPIQFCPKKEE